MSELGQSLERMSFVQLLLLLAFVAAYVLSLGAMLGSRWRRRAAALALVLAMGFAASTEPWVHGALLVVFVVAGLGLFVVLSWLLARVLVPRRAAAPAQDTAPAESASARPAVTLPPLSDLPADSQLQPARTSKRPKLAPRRAGT
jgi:hypothetical protein